MEKFSKSSIFLRSSLFVSPVACLLQIIGLACPNWISYPSGHYGLWIECDYGLCDDLPHDNLPDYFKAMRAMEVLGFLIALVACVLIALSVFLSDDSKKRLLKLLSIAACFGAGLFIIIGVIILVAEAEKASGGADITDNLSWAFGLCITSSILFIICGVLVVLSLVM